MVDDDRAVYKVVHMAFKTEYVVADSSEEARSASTAGWDTGDYVYGDPSGQPNPVCPVEDLTQVPLIGDKTVERLLEAETAVSLGPLSDTDALRDADVTRLRNQLDRYSQAINSGGTT